MAVVFQVGDIVWARMKGFCAWPGKISDPKPEIKRPAKKGNFVFVYFFGSNDCAWIPAENVWQFREFKHKFNLTSRTPKHFKEAVAAAESADSLRTGESSESGPATVGAVDQGSLAAGSGTHNVLPSIEDELMQMFPNRATGGSGTSSSEQPLGQQQPPPDAIAAIGTVNGNTSSDETPTQSQTAVVAAESGNGEETSAKSSRKRTSSEARNGSRTKANAAASSQGSSSSTANGTSSSKGRQTKRSKNVAAVGGAGDVAAVDGEPSAKIRRPSAGEGRSPSEATEAAAPVVEKESVSPRKRGRAESSSTRNADMPEHGKRVKLPSSKQPAQPSRPRAANSAEQKPLRRRAAAGPPAKPAAVEKAAEGSSKTLSSGSSSSVGSPGQSSVVASILSPSRRTLGGSRGAGVALPPHPSRGSATVRGNGSNTSVDVGSEPSTAAANDEATNTKSSVTAWEAPQKGQLVGFLGLGVMGSKMARRLLNAGHRLLVWNRTPAKCSDVVARGAQLGVTPEAVVCQCDITFSCVTDPFALKELVFGDGGVLQGISPGKLFVDLSTIDVDTATDISEAVKAKGGDFVEAPVVCTRARSGDDDLADDVLMVAGSGDAVSRCSGHFAVMAGKTVHVGGVGFGARMKLCTSAAIGVATAAVAESATLAEALGLSREGFFDALCPTMMLFAKSGSTADSGVRSIVDASLASDFTTHFALAHQQKDLRLAIDMADMIQHPMPVTASANELYKTAMAQGLGRLDMSAIWKTAQHLTK